MNKKNRNRHKRMPLGCKYTWKGMAKTNYRKQNKRLKFVKKKDITYEQTD